VREGEIPPLFVVVLGIEGGFEGGDRFFFLDPILGGWTYLWFCAWFSHMVLGIMVFSTWYFVDLVKGTIVML